ncbi:MAG: hypothetical protein RBS19_08360 [Bacteroidales bacterium]|nr:hypothetical protein [Bacteroidales bacterium]
MNKKSMISVSLFICFVIFSDIKIEASNYEKNDTIRGYFEIIQIKKLRGFGNKNNDNCKKKYSFIKGKTIYDDNKFVGFRGKKWHLTKINTCKLYLIMARHISTGRVVNIISFEMKSDYDEKIKINNQYYLTVFSITDFDLGYHSVIYDRITIDSVFIKEVVIDCCDPRIFKSTNIRGLFYKRNYDE